MSFDSRGKGGGHNVQCCRFMVSIRAWCFKAQLPTTQPAPPRRRPHFPRYSRFCCFYCSCCSCCFCCCCPSVPSSVVGCRGFSAGLVHPCPYPVLDLSAGHRLVPQRPSGGSFASPNAGCIATRPSCRLSRLRTSRSPTWGPRDGGGACCSLPSSPWCLLLSTLAIRPRTWTRHLSPSRMYCPHQHIYTSTRPYRPSLRLFLSL